MFCLGWVLFTYVIIINYVVNSENHGNKTKLIGTRNWRKKQSYIHRYFTNYRDKCSFQGFTVFISRIQILNFVLGVIWGTCQILDVDVRLVLEVWHVAIGELLTKVVVLVVNEHDKVCINWNEILLEQFIAIWSHFKMLFA